ncbi:MAG TPA: VOC family protein [Blastocatellia bacterium]|nr:VOC family protein [Blastocatellia bacterium]
MALEGVALHHVNVTVPPDREAAAKEFYAHVLGLAEIYKPDASRSRGAWYQLGAVQLHLSIEAAQPPSRRHVCYQVRDVEAAERHFRAAGVEILDDERPLPGVRRFFLRDPGGNRIEITEGASEN